jgi:hypothetical protein
LEKPPGTGTEADGVLDLIEVMNLDDTADQMAQGDERRL